MFGFIRNKKRKKELEDSMKYLSKEDEYLIFLLLRGHYVEAVKRHRSITTDGLAAAKDHVDNLKSKINYR